MLLKTSFLLTHLLCNVEFELNWFHNNQAVISKRDEDVFKTCLQDVF